VVAGKGIEKLRQAGITVEFPVIPEACREVNRRFFTFHIRKRPWVILKWAQTRDGFIDVVRNNNSPVAPNWISNDISRMIVHRWRAEEQGILVGTHTAQLDNPRLNVREWPGYSPVRMVIDRQRKLPSTLHLFDNTSDTFVFCASEELTVNRTRYVQLDFEKDIIPQMLARIASEGIQSIIVEGGRKLLTGFIESGLWDEARIFTGAKEFGSGILAPEIQAVKSSELHIREDLLTIYRNQITP
jgi:diaminohydroxyphosphoribosylaminopyrimidine deaminase/5-amino-6-(5-phosphoribosylamino)uracil reductase